MGKIVYLEFLNFHNYHILLMVQQSLKKVTKEN